LLNGKSRFFYQDYLFSYNSLLEVVASKKSVVPQFMSSPGTFLQFLYDLNVICYIEQPQNDKPYIRWCFRERSYANISPKVKEGVTYQVFGGLSKALNVGQEFS